MSEPAINVNRPVPVEPRPEEALLLAMLSYHHAYGFTALHSTVTRIVSAISKAHRAELAQEGWAA